MLALFSENCQESSSYHKDEGNRRKNLDATDRLTIHTELKKHTNRLTLKPNDPLINIAIEREANTEVEF